MKLTNEEKCTYCREYGNLPCEECDKKLEAKKAMSKTNREDEMIEMLRKIEDKLNDFHNDLAKSVIDMEVYNPLSSDLLKIKSLLQSLKKEK